MARSWAELRAATAELVRRLGQLENFLGSAEQRRQLAELEAAMAKPGFWNQPERSREVIDGANRLRKPLLLLEEMARRVEDLRTYLQFLEESGAGEGSADFSAVVEQCEECERAMDRAELQSFLSGPHDGGNAIVTIHSGAGGTEACDWAEMVLRMYLRWAERKNFTAILEDWQPGEEAGLSRAVFRLVGDNAYGYAKAERGVHRLVRISPFDANRRRHTSFCAVDVVAEIGDDVEVDIREEDLRTDTYRSSGKGGQHVNKTESAVRLTHLPTGIVVACQNERSQGKNRAEAMRILRARIYERSLDEKRSALEKFYGEKGEIGWGNQIRSYVFQPYQLVKDLRTGVESGNVQAVMDGEIDAFINGWLRAGCPIGRRGND
ncbi:MAG: peptide chain release factor 2 [Puniceicoccales bacterium]|jgi:peptide chain release factor 2|nr:peptide chain release factor 2 [Puniceicoccales bacterium]